jgi:murein DD-endopeptidase MepM/ murein hydrolase activator NlpD
MRAPVNNFKCALYPDGDVTQFFGENPTLYAPLGMAGHNGIDIVRPWGEHMFACADSTVAMTKVAEDGYGQEIRLLEDCGGGMYREWTYGHMSFIAVKAGQKLVEGQYVGNMGNTGFVVSGSTPFWKTNPYAGTHVHFQVRRLKQSDKGWDYYGLPLKVEALDYDNGYKGAIDPVPLLGGGLFTKSLGITMSGPDVALLQAQLVARGFMELPSSWGYFGPLTWMAVRRFQKAYLLPITGYFGRLTSEQLNSLLKQP